MTRLYTYYWILVDPYSPKVVFRYFWLQKFVDNPLMVFVSRSTNLSTKTAAGLVKN